MIVNIPVDKITAAKDKAAALISQGIRDKKETLKINYLQRTNLKAIYSRVDKKVSLALQANENRLEDKRNDLRKQLLEDETCLTYEYVEKAQNYAQKLNEMKKIKAEAILAKHEQERKEFADEMYKRLRIMNCDEFRLKEQLERRRMLNSAHEMQMLEKKQLMEKEKEIDEMYGKIMCNEKIYNEQEAEKRKKFLDRLQMDDCLKKQMMGHQMAKDEVNSLKAEEKDNWQRMAERMREEDRVNLEWKYQNRDNLRASLMKQIEVNNLIKAERKEWEDEMDRIFLEDLRRDLERSEQSQTSMKEETARELKKFAKVSEEFNQYKKKLDKQEEQQIFKIKQEKLEEIRRYLMEERKAKRDLAKEISAYWDKQVAEKQERIKQQKEAAQDERKFYEMYNFDLDKVYNLQKHAYAKQIQQDLLDQMEYNQRMEKTKQEVRLKEEIQAMEDDEAKRIECANMVASPDQNVHPFYRILFPNIG